MSATVFAAVLCAAALHAAWNAAVKGGTDKVQGLAAVIVGHLPFALAVLPFVPLPDAAALPWIASGIALHLGYQGALVAAYGAGDLTQVYPIARGSAPLLVVAVSVGVLGTALPGAALVAVALIGAGILCLLAAPSARGGRTPRAGALALLTGGFIAAYSLNDGIGARAAGTGVGFYAWLSVGNALVTGAILHRMRPGGLRRLAGVDLGRTLGGGGASFAAYAIVVWAFTEAPIALVAALRETSVVFALLIGVALMGERADAAKVAAILATLGGAALLRIAG